MKNLLEYILKNLLPNENFEVTETEEDGKTILTINTIADNMGLLIGKDGKTIRAIRNLIRIKATLENKALIINTQEKEA